MNMIRILQKYFVHLLVIIILFDITYSIENDTLIEGQRHGRVSGRIVKLYSGLRPDPILCHKEGFLADEADCSVFYRCLQATNGKYTVYRFQCGPGTVYDPDTEVCNHPRSTKRVQCGGLTNNKMSSTEKYIENEIDGLHKEIQELPSPIATKGPLESNSLSSTIVTPKPIKFENSYMTNSYPSFSTSNNIETTAASSQTPWNLAAVISTKKPWDYTFIQTTNYVTLQPTSQKGVQCTSDGFMGDYEDCRKFYRCVNNQRGGYLRYEFTCSESTIWDDDTQGCNHAWAVQRRRCGKGNNYNENGVSFNEQIKNNEDTPNNYIQQQTQISYGSKVTQIQTQISTGPAIQDQTQIHYGDRLNPVLNPNINQNRSQTNYRPAISQSQTQLHYGSEVTEVPPQFDLSNQISQTQAQLFGNTVSSTIRTTSIPYNKMNNRNKCTKEGFMGDSNDCKKFYRCNSNEKGGFTVHEFSCNEGTLWDENVGACNHAWAVKGCGVKKTSQSIAPPTTVIENTTFKYYTTTSSPFYNNEVGYGNQHKQQDLERQTSSTVKQTTILTTQATNSLKPHEASDCNSSGFFGNVDDCTKFYRCVENGNGKFTKYEYKCGDGTLWDSDIESCNHAWSVKSCNTSGNMNTQTNISEESNTGSIITTVSLVQTTTQKNNFDQDYDSGYQSLHSEASTQSTTTTKRTADPDNTCKTSGFMGDSDCKKFYRCIDNGNGGYTRHEFTCGEGTVWDPNIQGCNHAWAVKACGVNTMNDNASTSTPSVSQDDLDVDDSKEKDPDHGKESMSTSTSTPSSTTNLTPVTNKANDCHSSGFMGNDDDCKIFYRCVENGNGGFIRYEFSCGDGTVWDRQISACNHVWAVQNCGGSNLTSENDGHSTTDVSIASVSFASEISTQDTTTISSTISTSTTLNTNSQCITSGFIGDTQDCKKFYRCVEDEKGSYIRYEFTCGEGTVWDSNIQACNHERAVKSCGTTKFPDFENTSAASSITMKDEEMNPVTENNQEIIGLTENNSWSSSTVKTSTMHSGSPKCDTEGFMADSNDCKKFYRCVNDGKGSFIRHEFSCGDGTIWDSEINSCNHVHAVRSPCNSVITESTTTERKEPNYAVSSTQAETNEYSTTSKQPTKSQQCEQEGFIGDKIDCKKFYRCTDNGQGGFHQYEFTCGEGTIWDQQILACNHASSNANCSSLNKDPVTDNTEPYSTTTSSSLSQSTEKMQTSSSIDKCTSEGFYADSNDCKKFFRCVGDGKGGFTKYDFTCGEGTIWVQDIQACDHDTDNSLCGKQTNTMTTTPSHSSQESSSTVVNTSSTGSSTSDRPTSTQSTKPPMQDVTVSGSSSTSESSSTASASTSAPMEDHCEEAGYFGDSKDCKKFYRCVDDGKGGFTKYEFTCGEGTIWDQDITTCNHPQDVLNPSCENKRNNGTTTSTTSTTTTTTTTVSNETSEPTKGTSSTESTTTVNNNQSTEESSTKKPNNNNYTCSEAGFYADPYDCKKFYRCVDWGGDGKTFSIYHFDCGEGTIWDPNLQTCNHEESVYPPRDCSGTQSINENNDNTTTTVKQEETTESSTSEGTTTTTQSTTESTTTTTTEQSSTTDQSSTQQSSTSDQTTSTQESSTQSSTTEETTTQKSTTEQSTTQKSTTEQSTTQKSTTEQSTTESTTTQQSTSEQTTTQQSTTEQSTTQQSTTTAEQTSDQQSSTTQQSTTSEQTTTSNEETTTATEQTTTSQSTSSTDQTTKAEQTTTQESTEQSSENQSSTTEQSTTQETTDGSSTTESGQDTTTEQESTNKECPETDDDQYVFVCPTGFRRHPKYCNMFYQCTEDDDNHEMKVATFNCPNNTIYDENKTQCVEEEKADKKCDGQIAQRRRVKRLDASYKEPITVGRDKYLCPATGHFPFEKNEQCSPVLFKCEISKSGKLRGFMYQCPEGYFYWSISRRCEPVSSMSECRRELLNWNNRHEIPVERSNVARKTVK